MKTKFKHIMLWIGRCTWVLVWVMLIVFASAVIGSAIRTLISRGLSHEPIPYEIQWIADVPSGLIEIGLVVFIFWCMVIASDEWLRRE